MFTFKRRGRDATLAERQIEVWIAWENRANPSGTYQSQYDSWARQFVEFISKDDICDIEQDDVESFLDHVASTVNGQYPLLVAKKSVNALIRFYTARGKRMVRA